MSAADINNDGERDLIFSASGSNERVYFVLGKYFNFEIK